MDHNSEQIQRKAPWSHIIGYAMGEGAASLTMNGISAFAMLYYTQALGLRFDLAGIAFSVSSLWDALIDPTVGYRSDNTRSRWGRRHPYILIGGLLMAVCFYFVWTVPAPFGREGLLFIYVLVINILYRTAYAIFAIPYMALGFEICTDYYQRSQLQSARFVANMVANLLGPALGWSLFFPDKAGGREATSVAANFIHMGTVFAIFTAIFTIIVVLATRRYIQDTRGHTAEGKGIVVFFRTSLKVAADRYLRPIIIFTCIGYTGAIFVSTLQMYLYVYYMHLTALQKTLTHGGGMVLCGLGAAAAAPLAHKLDKKYAVCVGAAITTVANLLAGVFFLGGILQPTTVWSIGGFTVPIAVIVFAACNMCNWFGVGVFATISGSMIADVAEVNELKSGVRKDGSYAAISAFLTKLVASLATFIASACLAWVGFVSGSDNQTPEAIRRLVWMTFGLGSLFAVLIIPVVLRYPITHVFMVEVKEALARKKGQTVVSEPPHNAVERPR